MKLIEIFAIVPVVVCSLWVASAAYAEDELETEMSMATGKAVVKMIWGTQEEARAECEAARVLLPVTAPKYLSAYVEACFGLTASKFGPQKKPASCPYYQRAIDIWRENPPPADNDEIALKYAGKLKEWKDSVAKDCPSSDVAPTASTAGAAGALPVAVPADATIETLENISYVMPGGWTLENYAATGGSAYFKNNVLAYNLAVQREAANAPGDYPEQETLGSGRILEWHYTSFIKGGKNYMFFARVKFADAQVQIGITSSGSSEAGVASVCTQGIGDAPSL